MIVEKILSKKECWLCGEIGSEVEIETNLDTPGGKRVRKKFVPVHLSCYMECE